MAQHTPVLTPTFQQLIKTAELQETAIVEALRNRGWTAEKFGQGQLTEELRNHLRRVPTYVRWLPDIIAGRQHPHTTHIIFIDAKGGTTYQRTGNHDIQTTALEAAERWIEFTNHTCHYFYVFDDWSVSTPGDVRENCWDGRYVGNGSGTPFKLFPTSITKSFDAVFGSVIA